MYMLPDPACASSQTWLLIQDPRAGVAARRVYAQVMMRITMAATMIIVPPLFDKNMRTQEP